jgi:tetratricopeptide (TPR) repeat protein
MMEYAVIDRQARYKEAVRRGLAHNVAGEWPEAVRAFRMAIRESPQQHRPYAGLGEACFSLKQFERALDCYKLAARYSNGDIDYLRKVADLQERLGQLSEASRTYMAMGEIFLRRRQLEDALANWERAVRLDANLMAAHQRLASVFQRQNDVKRAVREYLAIARALQMRGEQPKAIRMALAAQRLDPANDDVKMALDLLRYGESALGGPEEPAFERYGTPAEPADSISEAVRQMASILEAERESQQRAAPAEASDPLTAALRRAQDDLAEEIFRDEEDEEAFYGSGPAGLSKLERDALIGQGMDLQLRGQLDDAITVYGKAIAGGLRLPAAYFTVGVLLMRRGRPAAARRALELAARNNKYRAASELALQQLI